MAFKTVKDYNEDRYKDLFILKNDGDYADVIFLYQSDQDVLVASVHYIKSNEYSGYVHCLGDGCPACERGIRTQTKLFIPLYDIKDRKIKFFDRSIKFEPQLQKDVFASFPNPSEFVFRITRHGEAGSMETYYSIQAIGKNSFTTYQDILNASNSDALQIYEKICRSTDCGTMMTMLSNVNNSASPSAPVNMPEYKITPRTSVTPTMAPTAESSDYVPEDANAGPLGITPPPEFEDSDMPEPYGDDLTPEELDEEDAAF